MLLGCAALVDPAGAVLEVCHVAVLYAAINNPVEWADAIIALAGNRSLQAAIVTAGRRRAPHFTWAQASQLLLNTMAALDGLES